jgi:cation diffusion facilitator family transporter
MSTQAPTARHPFGYGKAIYFWALIVALSMFTLGGGLSIYHGVQSLRHPEPIDDPTWNYVVLAIAAAFEGYSWNVSRHALNRYRRPGTSLWQAVHASKDASVFTVFIEDSVALLGLVVAALGIFLGQVLGNPYFDPAASVAVGLLLIAAAFTLARETGALLVGEGIGREQTAHLRDIFCADPGIDTVGKIQTMQLGPDEVLLTAAVHFKSGMAIEEVERVIDRLEAAVREANPMIQHVYFESAGLRKGMK